MARKTAFIAVISRMWLVLVNTIFVGLSVLTFAIAATILHKAQTSKNADQTNNGQLIGGFDMLHISYGIGIT